MVNGEIINEQSHAPKCPGCGKTPMRFSNSAQVTRAGAVISLIWCFDCGHIFHMSQIGQQQPAVIKPDPRFVRGN
jgi:hypothetical protein